MANKKLSTQVLRALAGRFLALGEVSRLQIIQELQKGESTVNALAEGTGLSQPNVSRHLKVLTDSGFIGKRKEGVFVYYKIIDETLTQICHLVCGSLEKRLY